MNQVLVEMLFSTQQLILNKCEGGKMEKTKTVLKNTQTLSRPSITSMLSYKTHNNVFGMYSEVVFVKSGKGLGVEFTRLFQSFPAVNRRGPFRQMWLQSGILHAHQADLVPCPVESERSNRPVHE